NEATVPERRTVRVECAPGSDCAKVRLVTRGEPDVSWQPKVSDGAALFTEPAGARVGEIRGSYESFNFVVDPAGTPPPGTVCRPDSTEMKALLDEISTLHAGSAVIVVDSLGHVFRFPDRPIDESDPIHVYAIGGSVRTPTISIRRVSPFSEMETYPIIGETSSVMRKAAASCEIHQYALLSNFRGGAAGQISINRALTKADGTRDTTRLGLVEIPVRRTYRGGLSLGIVRSGLADPDIKVTGADSTVVTRSGGDRYLYTLFFTPFYLRRAADDWTRPFYQYVTPQVGVVVNDVESNILYGFTAEVPRLGLFLGAGGHTGRVTRIPADGPPVRTNLRGTGRSVETEEVWQTRPYFSVSLDLRAASTFLSRIGK
ncbi:MAG TPA: hypothetical protein VE913_21630, partial [Longimicrobium sp.]|nr:hypothetical protein [Longimicrobium sp.]